MLNFLRSNKLTTCFMLSMLFILPNLANAQAVMRIAAVVNDDVISAHDLAQRINLTIATTRMPNTPEVRKRLAGSVLRTMIDERLKAQEGERLEIEVTDQQLKAGMSGFARSISIPPEKLSQALAQMGVDTEILEDQANAEISWGLAIKRKSRNRIKVTDKEVDLALAEIEANKGKPEYLYSEIYLPIETSNQEPAIMQMADRLVGHIKNGSPFAALARDFSKSTSALRGGELDWLQSGSISAEIETVLTQLPLGGYSNPIRTPSGLYLLHLRDKRISGQEENDETLSISQVIFPVKKSISADELAAKRGTARTLAYQAQSCDNLDELGKQIGGAKSGRVNDIKLSKMPPALRAALTPIGKGQVTTAEQKGAILVLMVCEREKVASMPEIAKKKAIKQRLVFEKVGREERRLLQKLRRSAFVDIRL